jgi:hypothetical protein
MATEALKQVRENFATRTKPNLIKAPTPYRPPKGTPPRELPHAPTASQFGQGHCRARPSYCHGEFVATGNLKSEILLGSAGSLDGTA